MKTIRAVLAAISGIVAIPSFAVAPTSNVIVTNTPLPVSVTNATTNQNVTVTNTNPIPVTVSPTETLFQLGTSAQSFSGAVGSDDLVTVPAGKTLVIEHISVVMNLFGANGLADARLRSASVSGGDEIDCHQTGTDGANHWFACSGMTRFYAGAGETVTFSMQTVDSVGAEYRVFISGHYVPAP